MFQKIMFFFKFNRGVALQTYTEEISWEEVPEEIRKKLIKKYPPLMIKKIVEYHHKTELFGTHIQELLNNANVTMTKQITVSEETSKIFNIEYEKNHGSFQEFNFANDIPSILKTELKNTIEETLKEKYSISKGTKITHTEQVTIEIPPFEKIRLIIHWKRVWLTGFIVIQYNDEKEFKIPFETVTKLFCEPETQSIT